MMTKTSVLLDEERERYELPRLTIKNAWPKYSFLRITTFAICALLALVFTAIYYGVFLGTGEMVHSVMQTAQLQSNFEASTSVKGLQPVMTSRREVWRKLHHRIHRVRRQKRNLADAELLDPMEFDFNVLRTKVRDKRTKIELSKLETDYNKCKREADSQSDCMATFMKMYKIATDISEKMEKMKQIFRDSDIKFSSIDSSSMEKYKIDEDTDMPVMFSTQELPEDVTLAPKEMIVPFGKDDKKKASPYEAQNDTKFSESSTSKATTVAVKATTGAMNVDEFKLIPPATEESSSKTKVVNNATTPSLKTSTSTVNPVTEETHSQSTEAQFDITVRPDMTTDGANFTHIDMVTPEANKRSTEVLQPDIDDVRKLHVVTSTERLLKTSMEPSKSIEKLTTAGIDFLKPKLHTTAQAQDMTTRNPFVFKIEELVTPAVTKANLTTESVIFSDLEKTSKPLTTRVIPETILTTEKAVVPESEKTSKPLTTRVIPETTEKVIFPDLETTSKPLTTRIIPETILTTEKVIFPDSEKTSKLLTTRVIPETILTTEIVIVPDSEKTSKPLTTRVMPETIFTTENVTFPDLETTTKPLVTRVIPESTLITKQALFQDLETTLKPLTDGVLTTKMVTFPVLDTTSQPLTKHEFETHQNRDDLVTSSTVRDQNVSRLDFTTKPQTIIEQETEINWEDYVMTSNVSTTEVQIIPGLEVTSRPLTTRQTDTSNNFDEFATTHANSHRERFFEGPRSGINTTISNHTADVQITYRGICGATNYEYKTPTDGATIECPSVNTQSSATEASVDLKTDAKTSTTSRPVKKKDEPQLNEDHPLDFPSSRENIVDDRVIEMFDQRAHTPKPTELQEEWRKKFEEGAIEDQTKIATESDMNAELIDSFAEYGHISSDKFGPKMNPTNIAHGGKNQQLMTLCEHLAKELRSKVTPVPEKSDVITQSPNVQFTSRGPGFPVTGETMKASAQFLYNPNFGVPSIPVCFYITPASFRMMMQPFWSPFFGMGMGSGNGGNSANPNGGIFIMPPSFGNMQNNGNFFGHSSPTATGSQNNIPNIFSKSARPQQQSQKDQQFFCTYMQNAGKQAASLGGGYNNVNYRLRTSLGNQSSPTDIVYSSYWNKIPGSYGYNLGGEDPVQCPLEGDVPCYGGNECVPAKKWCDSIVDCSDGSDEAACTCRQRIPEQRICDGYQDCPLGEDEIGCYGCDKFMYSCFDNEEEFERANRSTVAMCFSSAERCDGIKNCINGRDEQSCNLIVSELTHHMSHAASGSAGYLYRNHQGVWYPVCNNPQKWAREACTEELGELAEAPVVTFQEMELLGPFIEPQHRGEAHFPQSCQKRERDTLSDHVAHVRCPQPKCGIIQESTSPLMRSRRRRRRREVTENGGRIVGGSFSKPLHWPFVVALYRNGEFHCGGTIFNEQWIITAAHCVIGFHKYFYEVRAGTLRRSSFSSSTQIHHVTHVVVHQGYERRTMKNDLALLRIDSPLRFNRWVKPICLPDQGRTTMGDDWLWGPEVDTVCTVVGWGAVREKGPGSDHLREVHLPIRKRCSDKDDQEAEDICAGEAVGGRDACQGDSGGPLFCRSVSNNKEWYLAGVVSHGNGCARAMEFGVYTRVALYLDWVEMAMKPEYLPKVQPKQLCPGYACIWGGKRCLPRLKRCDRQVDCLGGEDEVGCIYNLIPDVAASINATTTPDREVSTTTVNEFSSTPLFEDLTGNGGGDTQPSSLDLPDKSAMVTRITKSTSETTGSTPPGPKSLSNWIVEEVPATPGSISSTTDAEATTVLPSSTDELTKLKELAVKFLDVIEFSTSQASNLKEDLKTTNASTTEVAETTEMNGFGEFKPDLTESVSENPTSVFKRENATDEVTTTSSPMPMGKSLSQKFTCKKIPQKIDLKNRCDRITDCEDGTDEEGCTCRHYLKGPLNILVCDGKVDCEDLTDEDDCGNCTATEFLCPMSKTCIALSQRCDNSVDCLYKEDEKDCFALTDGKEIRIDVNKQPTLQNAGIFSRNIKGLWRVVCSHETGYHLHAAKTAEEVCALLGFKGVHFHNTTQLTQHLITPIEPDFVASASSWFSIGDNLDFTANSPAKYARPAGLSSARNERIEDASEDCFGLFVECVPKSNGSVPLKNLMPGQEISPKTLEIHGPKPNVKPDLAQIFASKKDEILDKLAKLIETKKTVLVHDKLHEGVEKWHWPWLVDVYANGNLSCIGVLVDKHWVLVHESCYHNVRLDTDYVTVLLGGGKSKRNPHKSPHEQIKRVDCFEAVRSSDILLLHLDYAAHFTRHVLPTFLPDISSTEVENGETLNKQKLECMSVVHDRFGGIMVTPTIGQQTDNETTDKICSEDNELSCYQWYPSAIAGFKLKHLGEEDTVASAISNDDGAGNWLQFCKDLGSVEDSHNQGVIVCREDNSGWYPKAFYKYNATECTKIKHPFPVRKLEKYYGFIQDIIDQPKCEHRYPRPHCPTLRCPLGNCLTSEQMCNGKVDCHDGSDEEKDFCRLHRNDCKPSELKCRSNGKCVPKTKFCDHNADCEDLTDEPTICSCFTYLQATDPSKICDGIRNCWDKSDESPVLCNCTSNRFPCGSSPSECIPKDFVCDKEPDCPNGEDEQFCYGIEHPIPSSSDIETPQSNKQLTFPKGYGQVIEQSYGIWHTKCFPRHRPPDGAEVADICRKLGYYNSKEPSYRLIDDSNDIVAAAENKDMASESRGKYRAATKAAVINKFSPLHLNDDLTLILKPSRPIAELVKWNETDSSNCYRLEIKCS